MSFDQIIWPRKRFLISWGKDSDFIGKSAALSECRQGAKRTIVIFEFDANEADVLAYEQVWINGEV